MPLHKNLDPELSEAAEQLQTLFGSLDMSHLSLEQIPAMRQALHQAAAAAAATAVIPEVTVEEEWIPGPQDAPKLHLKIYRPKQQEGVLPCFYHIHGGGMILGDIEMEDGQMRTFADQLNAVVTNVEYRLAPEHPHPAPVEDCYAGLQWVADHADALKIDPTRIVVGGESAGGGLSAATVLLARDRGAPSIRFQYLIYPMLDDRNETLSSQQFHGNWPGWPREMNLLGWQALLGDRIGRPDVSPYAAPARATDLSNLPPAYLEVGTLEVFRDEDIAYAWRMMQQDVAVELHVNAGTFHAWELGAPNARVTQRAIARRMDVLQRALWG